jgi:DNA-binding NarL/FixJ family response regulator
MNNRRIKNQIGIITLLTVIFLLILIVFLINYNRNKLKQQQLRLELQNYVLQIHKMESEIKETRATPVLIADFSEFDEYDLTDREKEVLQMIARGYKNSEIAEKLFVSENTVKTHIKNIYVKLDVKNRVEALKRVKLVQ